MCKPTCCSNDSGSGLGLALAALIGLAVIVAVARPVIHAAEEILKIALITASALAGLALITVIILVIRSRCTNDDRWTPIHVRQWFQTTPPSLGLSPDNGLSLII